MKLRGQYAVTPDFTIGANVIGYSDQYVWGNENNQHQANSACQGAPAGDTERCAQGKGKISGYFVMNLDAQYNIGSGWKAFAKATNVFDRDYYVSGRLAETYFDSTGTYDGTERKMLGLLPGAPRAGWIGLRYDFAAPPKAAE